MNRLISDKVVVYCVRGEELLVFSHIDHPLEETGVQVPKGSVQAGEPPRKAAMRELVEETGQTAFTITRHLGRDRFDMAPYRDEIQRRFFFEARPTALLPEKWEWAEHHDGGQPATRFQFFWLPLRQAHVLAGGQSALIGKLRIC